MASPQDYLAAYDGQLRGDAETRNAVAVARHGPLWLLTFAGGRGFVTYRDLDDADAATIRGLVEAAVAHFRADPGIGSAEWKTRGHDRAPGLDDALRENGFVAEDEESIMVGEARLLAVDVELPDGVELRQVTSEPDVRALSAMQDEVFGNTFGEDMTEELLARLSGGDGIELWVAEADGVIVSGGRLEPVPDTEFAGIWGGATRPEWRGRGIYRALTAARARSALRLGKRLINSDSTEFSRPILERAGLVKISTTTPYRWQRGG
jgi:predicted N-acetyltransferase YhbS